MAQPTYSIQDVDTFHKKSCYLIVTVVGIIDKVTPGQSKQHVEI